jgi:ATP phosphoribosyltransferase
MQYDRFCDMVKIRVALPKGHLWNGTKSLLDQAGYNVRLPNERYYIAYSNDVELEMRIYRAQNIPPLVEEGKYDIGLSGHDWVVEHRSDVEELLDVEFGKVNIVAAIPQSYRIKARGSSKEAENIALKKFISKIKRLDRRIIIASEYEGLSKEFMDEKFIPKGINYKFIRSYGATEAFISDADLILECTETGKTLRENGWEPISTLCSSTARLIANKESLKDQKKKEKIDNVIMMLKGAIDARRLKYLMMNVPEKSLKDVIKVLPAMKSPTISKLYNKGVYSYAVQTAVPREKVVHIIPLLKKKGATDILEIEIEKAIS